MAISERTIEEVKRRANLLDVVRQQVDLKPQGRNFIGLCPFHTEKTPSFTVAATGERYRCFGCGKSGNVIQFVMETRGLPFPEAITALAEAAGITVEYDGSSAAGQYQALQKQKREMRGRLADLAVRYSDALFADTTAQKYLKARGILEPAWKHFHLGYAPRAGIGIAAQPDEILSELGLIARSKNATPDGNEMYEFFRDRIIFPIADSDGAVIAFGGRTLVDRPGLPKYLNTPESPLYHKRRSFYGLAQAVDAIRKRQEVLLVEGYMDVIALAQAGITHVIATCGTAVTEDHVQVLRRIAKRVYILFDGDKAGQKAAARSFELFLNSGLDTRAVTLPEGEDPDTLVRKSGADALLDLIGETSSSLLGAYIAHSLSEMPTSPSGYSAASLGAVSRQLAGLLRKVSNPVEQEQLVTESAQLLGVTAVSLSKLVRENEAQPEPRQPVSRDPEPRPMRKPSQLRAKPVRTEWVSPSPETDDSLGPMDRQLLIVALYEPSVIPAVLGFTSSLSHEPFSEILRSVLADLEALDFCGISHEEVTEPETFSAQLRTVESVLERHKLNAQSIITECQKQKKLNSINPKQLLGEVPQVAERRALEDSVKGLRSKEAAVDDMGERARLAQEKLLRRRELDQMKGKGQKHQTGNVPGR